MDVNNPAGELRQQPPDLDQITDEQAGALAAQVNLPMQTITLSGANLRVVKDDETGERAMLVGPLVFNFVLPLDQEAARHVARELAGGVEIASALPAGGLKVVRS
jgi:hypothetical protein